MSPPTTGTLLSFLHPTTSCSSSSSNPDNTWSPLPHVAISQLLDAKSSVLYRAADPTYPKQYLLVSAVDDVARVNVRHVAKFWGETESVQNAVDVRLFSAVEVFEMKRGIREGEENKDIPAHTLLIALMQPAPGGAAELDAWYREEHNEQMSLQPGWLRTCRYALVAQKNSSDEAKEDKAFSHLAIHEFEERNELGDTVKALEPVSEWTKKIMSEAEGIDAAIYRRVRIM